jgi:hypothetical protein
MLYIYFYSRLFPYISKVVKSIYISVHGIFYISQWLLREMLFCKKKLIFTRHNKQANFYCTNFISK